MTKIAYSVDRDKFHVEIKGHAGYAAAGNDIVCAAISVLIQTLAAHMENVTDKWSAHMYNGEAEVSGEGKEAVNSFLTILTGLKSVAAAYPEYVCITRGAL